MGENEELTVYVSAFVDELTKCNVRHAVISPGSRSTPMAMLMAHHEDMKVYMNMDERSAAFFALGMAKTMKQPVALLCTSGTAAANYLPALVEAKLSRIPLIVITADRPHELRDVGAPQAIDQFHLFGNYVKWFMEMALPEVSDDMIRYVRTVASRSAAIAASLPAGPVHLNFPFREPLLPNLNSPNLWKTVRNPNKQYVQVEAGERVLRTPISLLEQQLPEKGIIVCGQMDNHHYAASIVMLAQQLGYPILADPLSQLRASSLNQANIIDCYDTFLRSDDVANELAPELIIRFGAMPVSKATLLYMKKHAAAKHIVVDEGGGWLDPTLLAEEMIYTSPVDFCQHLLSLHEEHIPQNGWLQTWKTLNESCKEAMSAELHMESMFEGKVLAELVELLPDESALFVGNSMPIRDLDTFMWNTKKRIKVLGNRGANGIDGVVSTALGASVVAKPIVLVIGDLSFFHDLNGLLAAKMNGLDITIIVINNNGGGIFSFLPQAKEERHFEMLFGTPIDLDFQYAANMYGGTYCLAEDWELFRKAVNSSVNGEGLHIIEVKTDRKDNEQKHRMIWKRATEKVNNLLGEYGDDISNK